MSTDATRSFISGMFGAAVTLEGEFHVLGGHGIAVVERRAWRRTKS